MGDSVKTDVTKFARRNWKEKYDEEMQCKVSSRQESSSDTVDQRVLVTQLDAPDTAQGGVLKYGYLDLVYCNCMRIPMQNDNVYVVCSSIEDYVKYDQHRSQLVSQITAEDMKAEKRMYSDIVVCNRIWSNVTASEAKLRGFEAT